MAVRVLMGLTSVTVFVLAVALTSVKASTLASETSHTVHVAPSDPRVRTVGRFLLQNGELSFDHPDTQIFIGIQHVSNNTEITLLLRQTWSANARPELFAVLVDGELIPGTLVEPVGNCGRFCTFSMAGTDNGALLKYSFSVHRTVGDESEVRLFKLTEASWDGRVPQPQPCTFAGFELRGAQAVASAVTVPRRIEFLGDSITAGFCNLCEVDTGEGVDAENGLFAWPNQICSMLDAECHKIAWSGFGVVRNCCGGNTHMPEIYGRTLATVAGTAWNFSTWRPDAVVINLGTNDYFGNGQSMDGIREDFVRAYIEMVMTVARAYGGSTQFFLACGPMSDGYCNEVHTIIEQVKTHGVKAHFLDQRELATNACCGHPSIGDSQVMAVRGAQLMHTVLGWDVKRGIAVPSPNSTVIKINQAKLQAATEESLEVSIPVGIVLLCVCMVGAFAAMHVLEGPNDPRDTVAHTGLERTDYICAHTASTSSENEEATGDREDDWSSLL